MRVLSFSIFTVSYPPWWKQRTPNLALSVFIATSTHKFSWSSTEYITRPHLNTRIMVYFMDRHSTIFWPYQVLRMYCTRVHKGHLDIKRSCSNVLKCHLNLAVDFALKMSRRFRDNLFTATFHPDWQRHTFTFLNISPLNHSHFPVDIVLKGQCLFLMDSHIEQLERDGFPLQGKYFQ